MTAGRGRSTPPLASPPSRRGSNGEGRSSIVVEDDGEKGGSKKKERETGMQYRLGLMSAKKVALLFKKA